MANEQCIAVAFELNGKPVEVDVPVRETLADTLRRRCRDLSVHLGCEHGVCGACTIEVDGRTVRSCLLLAAQVHGATVVTAAGISSGEELSALQEEFSKNHALQCGFCTPGMLMVAREMLQEQGESLNEDIIRAGIAGNICRCTGYHNIVTAILAAAERRRTGASSGEEGGVS